MHTHIQTHPHTKAKRIKSHSQMGGNKVTDIVSEISNVLCHFYVYYFCPLLLLFFFFFSVLAFPYSDIRPKYLELFFLIYCDLVTYIVLYSLSVKSWLASAFFLLSSLTFHFRFHFYFRSMFKISLWQQSPLKMLNNSLGKTEFIYIRYLVSGVLLSSVGLFLCCCCAPALPPCSDCFRAPTNG